MALAHWMSLPWDFQPGAHLHACHHTPTVIATLKPELASENALCSMRGQGLGMGMEMLARQSRDCHQARSSWLPRGGVCGRKGLPLKEASMASKFVR